MKQTSTILQIVRDIPKAIANMQTSTLIHRAQEKRRLNRMNRKLMVLLDDVKKVDADMSATISLIPAVGSQSAKRSFGSSTRCGNEETGATVSLAQRTYGKLNAHDGRLLKCSNQLLHEVARNV
jgi:hypothetical protein